MPKYASDSAAQAMQSPSSAESRNDRDRSAFIRHQTNAGNAAAATRLKWPVLRAIIAGDQANTSPASHASKRVAVVARRARPYMTTAFNTQMARNTRLKDVTGPSGVISGNASRLRNGV